MAAPTMLVGDGSRLPRWLAWLGFRRLTSLLWSRPVPGATLHETVLSARWRRFEFHLSLMSFPEEESHESTTVP